MYAKDLDQNKWTSFRGHLVEGNQEKEMELERITPLVRVWLDF